MSKFYLVHQNSKEFKKKFYYERIEPYPWDFSCCNNIDLHPQHHPTQNIHIAHNLQVLNTSPKNETNSSWNLICFVVAFKLPCSWKLELAKHIFGLGDYVKKLSCGKQQPKLGRQRTSMHKKKLKEVDKGKFHKWALNSSKIWVLFNISLCIYSTINQPLESNEYLGVKLSTLNYLSRYLYPHN